MTDHLHDLLIVGGGPAGLSAGIYAARDGLDCILLEGRVPGGQLTGIAEIANYPGFPGTVSGFELAEKMRGQAAAFGLNIAAEEARGISRRNDRIEVACAGGVHAARAVIIATGATLKKLGVPGENRLTGRGVSYCGTCDGPLFRDRRVAVVGGGDTAVEEAVFIARFAARVTLIHRRNALRASPGLQRRAFGEKKIDFCWNSVVREIRGQERVCGVVVGNPGEAGEMREIPCEGVFIFVGSAPNTGFLKGVVDLDEAGRIVVDGSMAASLPGVFAAGDVRSGSVRQIASAVGDGVTAVLRAEVFLGVHG